MTVSVGHITQTQTEEGLLGTRIAGVTVIFVGVLDGRVVAACHRRHQRQYLYCCTSKASKLSTYLLPRELGVTADSPRPHAHARSHILHPFDDVAVAV